MTLTGWMLSASRRMHVGRLRVGLPPLAALGLAVLGLAVLLAGTAPRAAEFITPPGLNVEGQEAVLKEQVTRMARELVGDGLRDVVVSVRYIRTDGAGGQRIKLPGVNHFIAPSAAGGGSGSGSDIVAGHARVRQIMVTVADSVETSADALARELRQQGRFDPAQGDMVRVLKVGGSGDDELKQDTKELSDRLKEEQNKQAASKESEQLGRMIAEASLAEAQATTFLIRARQAYFSGDYDRALDQILQSISQNPNNPQAYAMLGSLYYAVDWKHLALKYWEKSLALDPDNRELQELITNVRNNLNS